MIKRIATCVASLFLALLLAACGADSPSSPGDSAKSQSASPRPVRKAVAADYQDEVQELYIAYFGRPADPNGLAGFEAALAAAGAPSDGIESLAAAYATNPAVRTLIDSFGSSAESQALYGGGDTTAFVKAIFQNVLGRAPATAGLNFWVGQISNGTVSNGSAAAQIMVGALTNTTAQGQLDGQLILNRLAVAEYFTAQLVTQGVVNAYAGSAAAGAARTMLSGVTASTDPAAYQATASAEITTLVSLKLSGGSGSTIVLLPLNPLPSATVGQAYSNTVVLGISPSSTYSYSIDTLANGVLPTGMTLGINGVLSGTPFATGAADVNGNQIPKTYTFGVCATDTLSRNTTSPCPQTSITVYPIALTVTLAGTGAGTVSSSPSGISCGTQCGATFNSGTSVTLTAAAASGSSFTGWSGACSGTSTCVVAFNSAASVTATFTLDNGAPSASFASASCTPVDSQGDDSITYTVTVDGPVGTFIEDMSSYGNFAISSCGAWEVDSLSSYACTRGANDSASANVTFVSTGGIVGGASWPINVYGGASGYPNIEIGESVSCP